MASCELQSLILDGEPVEQEAKDPYLCYWADWYYLVLCAAYLSGIKVSLRRAETVNFSGRLNQPKSAIVLDKQAVTIGYPHWGTVEKRVNLGSGTSLIMSGEFVDWIVTPQLKGGGYYFGRKFTTARIIQMIDTIETRNSDYLYAQRWLVEEARLPGESYASLYERARQSMIFSMKGEHL